MDRTLIPAPAEATTADLRGQLPRNADTIQEDEVLTEACAMVYGCTRSDAQGMVEAITAERRARVLDAIYSELMK